MAMQENVAPASPEYAMEICLVEVIAPSGKVAVMVGGLGTPTALAEPRLKLN
jgi:hypothetical protein